MPDVYNSKDTHRGVSKCLFSRVLKRKTNLMRVGLVWMELWKRSLMYHLKSKFCCEILRTRLTSNKHVTIERT